MRGLLLFVTLLAVAAAENTWSISADKSMFTASDVGFTFAESVNATFSYGTGGTDIFVTLGTSEITVKRLTVDPDNTKITVIGPMPKSPANPSLNLCNDGSLDPNALFYFKFNYRGDTIFGPSNNTLTWGRDLNTLCNGVDPKPPTPGPTPGPTPPSPTPTPDPKSDPSSSSPVTTFLVTLLLLGAVGLGVFAFIKRDEIKARVNGESGSLLL